MLAIKKIIFRHLGGAWLALVPLAGAVISGILYGATPLRLGIDHGEIAEEHDHETEKFIDSRLKDGGKFSAEKIHDFLNYLQQERERLRKDLYETKLFEKLKIEVKKFETAQRKAEEEADPKESPILRGFDEYVLPKMQLLYDLVSTGQEPQRWQGVVDEFVRGYITYYMPNAYRSTWPNDTDIPFFAKKMIVPYRIKRQAYSSPEAMNLQIAPAQQSAAETCLKRRVSPQEYLNQKDLQRLAGCGFDISTLNPGLSLFWHEPSEELRRDILKERDDLFPHADEKIFMQRVRYRARTSPKITAYFIRNDKKVKFKLKMGQEVPVDTAMCKVLKLLGLDQDETVYRPRVRVYLEDSTYEEFISEIANKYHIKSIPRVISAHGREGDLEWVDLEDVMFEGRGKEELRLAPVDLWSWDFSNRREYRAMLMIFGWLGMNDMQPNNFKQLFDVTKEGLLPKIRIQDPGLAFGGPYRLNKLDAAFGFGRYYRPNVFPTTFMSKDEETDEVKIFWNDFALRKRAYGSTTWSDLRWMARKIARLDPAQINEIFLAAGMPEPVATLLLYKLLARRNEIIKYFDLAGEFPFADVPDFREFNLKKDGEYVIKKGKLVQTSFPGKNTLFQVVENWWTAIPALMNFNVPINEWRFSGTNHRNITSLSDITGIDNRLNLEDYAAIDPVTTFPIGAGIQATLSRSVRPNIGPMNALGKFHLYQITDRIRLRVGIDSPLFRKIIQKVSMLDGRITLDFFEKEFEFIHYKDKVKDAYLSKFALLKILRDMNNYVAFHLEPLEVIRVYHKYGLDFTAAVGVGPVNTPISNEVGVTSGVNKLVNRYFMRDQFGQIHYFIDKGQNAYAGFKLGLGGVDVAPSSLSLINVGMSYNAFKNHQKDWIFKLPEHDRDNDAIWRNDIRQYEEFKALNTLTENARGEDLPDFVDVNYEVQAKGSSKTRNFGLFYLFNHFKSEEKAESTVRLPDGRTKSFFHLTNTKNKFVGLDEFLGNISTFDICVKNRRRTRIEVELEQDEAEKFTINIKTEDFFRSRDLAKVRNLITDLNYRYSTQKSQAFYRDFSLPSQEEVNKYPRVYGLTYTLIYGRDLLDKLKTKSREELRSLAEEHFTSSWYLEAGDHLTSESALKDFQIRGKVDKVLSRVNTIWQLLEEVPSAERSRHLCKAITKLITATETDVFGLYFFRRLLDGNGMFVMGEISGLLRSFSNLNDLQQQQRRRFMAESWGEFKSLPPLQKFLRRNRLVPPSVQIRKLYSDTQLFGRLETGVAPNLESLYTHDGDF